MPATALGCLAHNTLSALCKYELGCCWYTQVSLPLQACMQSAAKQQVDGSFHFDGLVRVLCSSPAVQQFLREEDTAFQQHKLHKQGRQANPKSSAAQLAAPSALNRPPEEIVAVVVT